ncbi:hypothetical protein [Shewanella glacialipiscicola]|uniref:Uncharacterized protein n=1 Tax=Shewanella glacialipiscicola TaxID=614069 RepID=A0ABQ6J3Q9_9GAMM|nr:hypothetical protein [Shewanella glacialipiscicola]GMA82194.1 hypothetical protein GCM10025855_17270 [Shewanella glacialipiscicola]
MASLLSVKQWDIETDVLILGFGLAGASAAIEALDADPNVKVTICEKIRKSMLAVTLVLQGNHC